MRLSLTRSARHAQTTTPTIQRAQSASKPYLAGLKHALCSWTTGWTIRTRAHVSERKVDVVPARKTTRRSRVSLSGMCVCTERVAIVSMFVALYSWPQSTNITGGRRPTSQIDSSTRCIPTSSGPAYLSQPRRPSTRGRLSACQRATFNAKLLGSCSLTINVSTSRTLGQ